MFLDLIIVSSSSSALFGKGGLEFKKIWGRCVIVKLSEVILSLVVDVKVFRVLGGARRLLPGMLLWWKG